MGPVLMLHGILLPLNIFRLVQMQKERQHGNSEFMQVPELMPGSGHVVVDQACRSDRARHAIVLLSPNERRFGPDSMDRRGIGEMTSDASYDQ
jgi:hypothetical protein